MPLGRARCGATIPSDLLAAKCIPPGFMVQKGWEIVSDYYQRQKTVRHAGLQPQTSSPPSRQGGGQGRPGRGGPRQTRQGGTKADQAGGGPRQTRQVLVATHRSATHPFEPLLAQGDWVPYSKVLGGLTIAPNLRTMAEQVPLRLV